LVYRVKEIPASLFPLIWDFGTLNVEAEKKYITQMVNKSLGGQPQQPQVVVQVLYESQKYMRSRVDECSFVSLRDVERTLTVLEWFLSRTIILARVQETEEVVKFSQ
jgi:hypothetical protein